jgi:hypothetical protein
MRETIMRRRNVHQNPDNNNQPAIVPVGPVVVPESTTNCSYEEYPCIFHVMVGNGFRYPGKRWPVFTMRAGAKLYVGVLPSAAETRWWEAGPPSGLERPGPYFTTVIKRAEAFNGVVLEYTVRTDTALVFTANQGGWEVQEDVFDSGEVGYFSCKECEVSVRNDYADRFVDWQNVHDISDIVFGRRLP